MSAPQPAVQQQKPPPKSPPRPSRMQLAMVSKGKQNQPRRIFLYGPEGIGKSTFAADAPNPIFLGAEDGTSQLDIHRFPTPRNWLECLEAVDVLRHDAHSYQTLAIDTADWIEPLIFSHICARDREANVEAYGYGKGYQVAVEEWRQLLLKLEQLRAEKRMEIIILGHSLIKTFKNPEGHDFDRYQLKMNEKAGGLLKEWSDVVLFANFETFAKGDVDKNGKLKARAKGISTGARFLRTVRNASWDAKNRYNLPEELPLSYADFDAATKSGEAAVPDLVAEIKRKAAELGPEMEKATLDSLSRVATDATKLSQLNVWVNTKLASVAGSEN